MALEQHEKAELDSVKNDVHELKSVTSDLKTKATTAEVKLDNLSSMLAEVKADMVTSDSFLPVQRAIYFLIALVATGFVASIIAYVWPEASA